MDSLKSLRTIKLFLPVVALIFIVFTVFAFRGHTVIHSADQEVWLHYDCANNGEVLEEPDNIEPAGTLSPFGCSGQSGNVCAIKYNFSDLQETMPGSEIYIPKAGAVQRGTLRCNP